jgi:prepilin-type N-terminal cleavage/methylation domain-containing protein
MTLLQAYLNNPRTRRAFSTKPGQAGFSLIELVVVIAVLAVLVAVALPNFLGVNDDGAVRSAQNAVTNALKECAINRTRGSGAGTFSSVSINGYRVSAGTATATAPTQSNSCDRAGNNTGIGAYNPTGNRFPSFHVTWSGTKSCGQGTGTDAVTTGCTNATYAVDGWN